LRRFKIEPIVVTGYHGTSLEAAEDILREGFKPSRRPWEWLGHGIYFWQDAPIRAFEWATEWLGQKGYVGPIAVVAAEINLSGFVDLLDQQGMRLLRTFAEKVNGRPEFASLANRPPVNRLDCALFNFATYVLSLDGVRVSGYRAAVVEGKPLTLNSPIHELSHVQLAVIERDVILRTWMVESDAEGAP
jgi:hypothetical protein